MFNRTAYFIIVTLLGACSGDRAQDSVKTHNRTFTCSERLPAFTLGPNSEPNPSQVKRLCECIWGRLSEDNKNVALEIRMRGTKNVADKKIGEFAGAFSDGVRDCGGMEM